MTNKNLTIGLVIAILIAVSALFLPRIGNSVGVAPSGQVHYQMESFQQGVQLGQRGTPIKAAYTGTCNLTGMNLSHTASTTKAYPCAATGVISGDQVFVTLSTSTPMHVNGWVIAGAKASSTAGFIDVVISNFTGTDRIPSSMAVGSSTQYHALRD